MEESQMARFIPFLHERLKGGSDTLATEAWARMEPPDISLMEQFVEHIEKAEQERAEREADPQHQAES